MSLLIYVCDSKQKGPQNTRLGLLNTTFARKHDLTIHFKMSKCCHF